MKLGSNQKVTVLGRSEPDAHAATLEVLRARRGGGHSSEQIALATGETVEAALQRLAGEVQRSNIEVPDASYPDVNETSDPERAAALAAASPEWVPENGLPKLRETPNLLQFRSAKMDEGKLSYVTCSKSGGRNPKVSFNFSVEPPHAPYTHTFSLDPKDAIAFAEYLIKTAKQDED